MQQQQPAKQDHDTFIYRPASKPQSHAIGSCRHTTSVLRPSAAGNSRLAEVSKTPGKTRCINHFLINRSFYLVDLPGYGYARVARDARLRWQETTQQYLLTRPNLANVLLLVDASLPPKNEDLDGVLWLAQNRVKQNSTPSLFHFDMLERQVR